MATINGTTNGDNILGSSKSDTISAGAGNDIVSAGNGNDQVYGGDGHDVLDGGAGNDNLFGDAGNDTLTGGDGNDGLYGGDGDDVLDGGDGSDAVHAGAGDDRVIASYGNDLIDAGAGIDTYDASALDRSISLNLATGSLRGPGNASVYGVENVTGSRFADTITGTSGANVIDGNGGDDRIYAGLGDDTIIAGSGNGSYSGEGGSDKLVYVMGTGGTQVFDGGSGFDTVQVVLTSSQLTAPVITELSAFTALLADPVTQALGFQFAAIGALQVTGAEALSIVVDGEQVPLANLLNAAPQIDASSHAALDVAHNAAVSGEVLASDANGDTLTYSVVVGPAHGTLALDAATGRYVYTAGDHVGDDGFTVRVSDGKGGTADHAVSVTLTNEAPDVLDTSDASLTVAHGHSVEGSVDASDAEGDGYAFSIATGPEHGTLVFTDESGSYVYTADDYVGYDSFTVRVTDAHGGSVEHTVSVNATNTGPAIDPGASTGFFSTYYDQTGSGIVVATDTDGDDVTFALKSGPAHGMVHVDADGRFTYTPVDYAGTDSFVVTASDGFGGSVDHTVDFGVIGTLDTSAAAAAVSVNLSTGAATGVDQSKLAWAVNVLGSAFNDLIYGDARANILTGGAGKDEVHGLGGNDYIEGGLGDDKLFGEDGNDVLAGGDGKDALNGGAHHDVLRGGAGNDGFFGGGGDDHLYGDEGDDRIYGDGGNDRIQGGAGSDIMTGAGFNNGGARGTNTYVWEQTDLGTGLDHITDFGAGDRMDFTGMFTASPASLHDVVRVVDTAAGLVVSVDAGGTSGFVDVVVLDNVHGMTVDDLDHNGMVAV